MKKIRHSTTDGAKNVRYANNNSKYIITHTCKISKFETDTSQPCKRSTYTHARINNVLSVKFNMASAKRRLGGRRPRPLRPRQEMGAHDTISPRAKETRDRRRHHHQRSIVVTRDDKSPTIFVA